MEAVKNHKGLECIVIGSAPTSLSRDISYAIENIDAKNYYLTDPRYDENGVNQDIETLLKYSKDISLQGVSEKIILAKMMYNGEERRIYFIKQQAQDFLKNENTEYDFLMIGSRVNAYLNDDFKYFFSKMKKGAIFIPDSEETSLTSKKGHIKQNHCSTFGLKEVFAKEIKIDYKQNHEFSVLFLNKIADELKEKNKIKESDVLSFDYKNECFLIFGKKIESDEINKFLVKRLEDFKINECTRFYSVYKKI